MTGAAQRPTGNTTEGWATGGNGRMAEHSADVSLVLHVGDRQIPMRSCGVKYGLADSSAVVPFGPARLVVTVDGQETEYPVEVTAQEGDKLWWTHASTQSSETPSRQDAIDAARSLWSCVENDRLRIKCLDVWPWLEGFSATDMDYLRTLDPLNWAD